MKKSLLLAVIIYNVFINNSLGQIFTKEDSLNAGLVRSSLPTVLSGYGEAKYTHRFKEKTAGINLTRAVLFMGHRFNKNITFFSELEIEDAKIKAGDPGGEISMEQAFLKMNINRDNYLVAGLFIPRIGIINENHLPTTYNGNERPQVERNLIPATWRELGVGLYGNSRRLAGLNYSLAIVNGLNSSAFKHGSGIRSGRFAGKDATARNLAVTASLLHYVGAFRLQTSAYMGGSVGLAPNVSDTLGLSSGTFSTPIFLYEANAQFRKKGLVIKALGATIQIPQANRINNAFGNNTAKSMIGGYVEVGYNVLKLCKKLSSDSMDVRKMRNLTVFGRYEYMDLNATMPDNAIKDGLLNQQHLVAGITYMPMLGVSIKIDYRHSITGTPNTAITPMPNPFYSEKGYLNLGLGYSF